MAHEMDKAKRVSRGNEPPVQVGSRVEINIGHACNNRCIFCMQHSSDSQHKRWVPLDKFTAELDYYHRQGVRELGILGGEPTLYPWLFEGLQHAKNRGFGRITINSNGSRFADMDFTRRCAEAGITRFCLSVHSHVEDIEDTLSARKGAWADKVQAIKNINALRAEGLPIERISLNPVLNRMNMEDMEGFVAYYKALGVKDIRFNAIRPEGGAHNSQSLVPRYHELMPHIIAAIRANEARHRIVLTFGEIPLCVWPKTFFKSDTLTRRYIGELRDLPTNVTEFITPDDDGRRRFLWQDLKCDVLKTLTEACKSCALVKQCGGVWTNYIEMYGEHEFSPMGDTPEDI